MNTAIFQPVAKTLAARRPAWTFVIEDNLVRIQTNQFTVDWAIIEEITESSDYKIEEVTMHQALGVVISIRYLGGT